MDELASTFWELIRVPFRHNDTVWGIIPLYVAWLINEITDPKASYRTAIQTGFGFLWAGLHWAYLSLYSRPAWMVKINLLNNLFAVSVVVTLVVILLGAVALFCGVRKRFPPGCSFLGHVRFSSYFMITVYAIQANYLQWSWDRVAAIVVFALPVWLGVHLVLKPWRKR